MTKPHEVTVTREDAAQLRRRVLQLMEKHDGDVFAATAEAMAEWLAARVPDHMFIENSPVHLNINARLEWCLGHNDCRDAVLRGPQ